MNSRVTKRVNFAIYLIYFNKNRRKHDLLVYRMPFAGEWCKVWIYFGFVFAWAKGARPRFDTSTDMGLVLVPADAEVDSVIFRLRATDQDADFPLVFEITGNNEYLYNLV